MKALLLAVATGVLATMLWWAAVRLIHLWRAFRLSRLARRERKAVRRLLANRLAAEGVPRRRLPLNRARVELLARSFRLRITLPLDVSNPRRVEKTIDASHLIEHVKDQSEDLVYLVNADSGFGKTVLGLALPLLRSRVGENELLPLYIDLGEADSDKPLNILDGFLDDLKSDKPLRGRPLFVFDALNETVDPERFADRLALKRNELEHMRAQMLFLFSFRHRSYPGRLRTALVDRGFGPLEHMELAFEIDADDDLAFFPHLLQAKGGESPPLEDLKADLQRYSIRFPTPPMSRADAAAYLTWRYVSSAKQAHPGALSADIPSPAALRFASTIGEDVVCGEDLFRLTRVAFRLLSEETMATSYAHAGLGGDELRRWVAAANLGQMVDCDSHYLRFANETTVRVLGALDVARRLLDGGSPAALRGRTTYDVCAPFVRPALRWVIQNEPDRDNSSAERLTAALLEALSGRDAPYSFYATVLCGDDTGVFGESEDALSASLFHEMIAAIDLDREQTWRGSLEDAGRSEPQPILDPVLDQLFEVTTAYGNRAVDLLLAIMEDPAPLIKSQAAYLLLDWVGSVSRSPNGRDMQLLAGIPSRMDGSDGNLHFRFHQVELLERLLGLFQDSGEPARGDVLLVLGSIVSTPGHCGDGSKCGTSYADCQELVALRARHLLESTPSAVVAVQLGDGMRDCIEAIGRSQSFQSLGRGPEAEALLECWEVALGMAVHACGPVRRNAELTAFVEHALDHEHWIVRWWAFYGLIGIVKQATSFDDRVLAARCARRAVHELYTGVEPIGLKHRQCALVGRLRDDEGEAGQVIRSALTEIDAAGPTTVDRQSLGERYYEVMGASPDDYLSEFFRRLDGYRTS